MVTGEHLIDRMGAKERREEWSPERCGEAAILSQLQQDVFSPSPTVQSYTDTCSVPWPRLVHPQLQPQWLRPHQNPAPHPLAAQGGARAHWSPGAGNPAAHFGFQPGPQGLVLRSAEIRGKRAAGFQRVKEEPGSGTSATPWLFTRDVVTPGMLPPTLTWNFLILPRWILHSFLMQNLSVNDCSTSIVFF